MSFFASTAKYQVKQANFGGLVEFETESTGEGRLQALSIGQNAEAENTG